MRTGIVALVAVIAIAGCSKSSSTSSDSAAGNNGGGNSTTLVTSAQLSGGSIVYWFGTCTSMAGMGADMTNMSYNTTFGFHSNLTYDYALEIFNDSSCGMGGGTNVWSYDMFGNYALNGAATAVSGATQISFTRSSELISMYGHTSPSSWPTYLNSFCTGGATPNFGTSVDSSQDPFGFICTHTGSTPIFTLPNFPATSATTDNVVKIDTSATPNTITMSLPTNLWWPGNSSYPTSASLLLTHQ